VPDATSLERIWYGRSAAGKLVRAALAPAEAVFALGVRVRGSLYDHGVLRVEPPEVPAVSVGNLTAGGTGKTPVAAWFARRLTDAGAHPAVVMRGYGDDEPLVHRRLNPDVPVLTSPDRLAGTRKAAAQGADCIVLDDAFQHRRIGRTADVVLVSADRWDGRQRLLPAGPWREPLSALGRATLVLVTRKAADRSRAQALVSELANRAGVPVAGIALELESIRGVDATEARPLTSLAGRRVLAISAIGDPSSFRRQLEDVGASVRAAIFPDHHRFTTHDARTLAEGLADAETALCTLKDHVKLAPLWPRAESTLWYVSQRVVPESGESAIDEALDAVLHARKL
jgi:tetraacyldisaccharide 4'-kinase